MGIVSTIPEKCKRCYTCVRECPAKAIRVAGGQATVIEERCIACGNCVKVCAQQAKLIADAIQDVQQLLSSGKRVFACLAPSFAVAFHPTRPGKIIAAIRQLGFAEVWQVAFGAEMVSEAYEQLFETSLRTGKQVISTPCPAIVSFVSKYMPSLREALAPIVSPMIALGRAIRKRHGDDVAVVFIGPCIAKKNEIHEESVDGVINAALSFKELASMFETAQVDPEHCQISDFDGPRAYIGRSFPISGGLLRTAGLSTDILENAVLITEGKDRVLTALHELEDGNCQARLFDVLFCEGCINGPKMLNDLSVFARKEILANFIKEQNRYVTQRDLAEALAEFEDVDLSRTFQEPPQRLTQPTDEEITHVLQTMHKFGLENQLNCGACGYVSCREKAIAVCQGLAEPDMCLPYVVEELERTCRQLQQSNTELSSTQQRLLQSEKMASMGQISAGVAHEINNPLGTILIYSHMLLKQLNSDDPRREDFELIANEATRCKTIVRGLLDFARQSRVSKTPTNLAAILNDVAAVTAPKAKEANVRVNRTIEANFPIIMVDSDQIRQMFINLVNNGIDAIVDSGKTPGDVDIAVRINAQNTAVQIEVSDSGCGIPQENLSKLFTPFFTTKELGKGTGLGLAIVYGVVKMHSGDITVESDAGQGTTFLVTLPLERAPVFEDA